MRWTIGFLAVAVGAGVVGFGGMVADRTAAMAAQGICIFAVILLVVSLMTNGRLSAS